MNVAELRKVSKIKADSAGNSVQRYVLGVASPNKILAGTLSDPRLCRSGEDTQSIPFLQENPLSDERALLYCRYTKYVTPMVLYKVGYIDRNGHDAEVQFKVHAGYMMEEMANLFSAFCRENGCDPTNILYTEYVGPATDEE